LRAHALSKKVPSTVKHRTLWGEKHVLVVFRYETWSILQKRPTQSGRKKKAPLPTGGLDNWEAEVQAIVGLPSLGKWEFCQEGGKKEKKSGKEVLRKKTGYKERGKQGLKRTSGVLHERGKYVGGRSTKKRIPPRKMEEREQPVA